MHSSSMVNAWKARRGQPFTKQGIPVHTSRADRAAARRSSRKRQRQAGASGRMQRVEGRGKCVHSLMMRQQQRRRGAIAGLGRVTGEISIKSVGCERNAAGFDHTINSLLARAHYKTIDKSPTARASYSVHVDSSRHSLGRGRFDILWPEACSLLYLQSTRAFVACERPEPTFPVTFFALGPALRRVLGRKSRGLVIPARQCRHSLTPSTLLYLLPSSSIRTTPTLHYINPTLPPPPHLRLPTPYTSQPEAITTPPSPQARSSHAHRPRARHIPTGPTSPPISTPSRRHALPLCHLSTKAGKAKPHWVPSLHTTQLIGRRTCFRAVCRMRPSHHLHTRDR